MTDLSCGRFLELLAAHPEGRLSTAAGVAFPAHAARCATCRAEAECSERLLRLERAAFRTPAEDELPESLVQAILAAHRRSLALPPALV